MAKGLLIILAFALCAALVYRMVYTTVHVGAVGFQRIVVDDAGVTLEQGSFAGSAMWYVGYRSDIVNGELCVFVRASTLKLPYAKSDPFDIRISIPAGASISAVYVCDAVGGRQNVWMKE